MKFVYLKIAILLFLWGNLLSCKENKPSEMVKLEGLAFGTTFHITYFDKEQRDVSKSVDSLFYLVNKSLSTYIPNSDISKINKGDTTVVVDDYFVEVYQKALKIYKETDGVFDPTIGVLVNAWGFGPEKLVEQPDSVKINQLMSFVGFDKVQLIDQKIRKENDAIYFDFNAIAKGYALDIAGRFLENNHIDNYLIEIGGEIRTRGINKDKNKQWSIGVENPNFDGSRSINKVIALKNESAATSGSYRKFNVDESTGEKYSHILNVKTGYPAQNSLLSTTVIANLDCADVDGYATALMAMSLEDAQAFLEKHKELRVFLIFSDEKGNLQTFTTSNF